MQHEVLVELGNARKTIRGLIEVHKQTVRDIDAGKRFHKDGEDITSKLRERVVFEIRQCQMVDDALDHMKAANIKRAAELCSQIREHILNVQ